MKHRGRALKHRYGRSTSGTLVKVRIRRTPDWKLNYGVVVDSKNEDRVLAQTADYSRTHVGTRHLVNEWKAIVARHGWKIDNSSW